MLLKGRAGRTSPRVQAGKIRGLTTSAECHDTQRSGSGYKPKAQIQEKDGAVGRRKVNAYLYGYRTD